MMFEKKEISKPYPIITMIIGLISFSFSSLVTAFLSNYTNEGIIPLVGIPSGTILMALLLKRLRTSKLLSILLHSVAGGFISFIGGFALGYMVESLLKDLKVSQNLNSILANLLLLIVVDAIFGAIMAHCFFNSQAIRFFAISCGIISIPFGILLSFPINVAWLGTDLNLVLFIISLGTSTGFSYGLYSLHKSNE